MKYLKYVGLIGSLFTAFASHAAMACDEQIKVAALQADPRVQSGNKHCEVGEPATSDFGAGHGIVGSVDVTCLITTDEGIPVESKISYDFHLFPGSCEVTSIEQSQE